MKKFNVKDIHIYLEQVCDLVIESKEEVILERLGKEDVALIAASELNSLKETLYLLSSSANAQALFEAIEEVKRGKLKPQTIDELINELEFN